MTKALLVFIAFVGGLVSAVPAAPQSPVDPRRLQAEVSAADIERTLRALDVERTAGSEGERTAADYLVRKLTEFGIKHAKHDSRMFLSWPGRAELILPGAEPIAGKTAAFAAPTPANGLRGVLLLEPKVSRLADQRLEFGSEVRGKIPVVRGIVDTEALVLAGQRAGALAVVQIDETDKLHEDIVSTIWGTPTTESAGRLPTIPYVCITKADGERVKAVAAAGGVTAQVRAEVTRGWRTEPNVVAEVPGRSGDFILVTTHVDAWYRGMTDTAGSVASILDMARILQKHQSELERGVRFGWWTGHSFGRYAGSGWYVDHFWPDLDAHCVAYTNLDGPGRRGSRMDAVSAGGWPGLAEYAVESAERLTGRKPAVGRRASQVFRPGRDSDSAYQGLGIPFFSIGVPGPPSGHADVDSTGRIAYWHAPDDTFDKLDMKALALDTQYRVAQLYDLATARTLPHRLGPIAASYRAALADLAGAAGSTLDLSAPVAAAAALEEAAARFDSSRPHDQAGAASFNRLVVDLTHQLNATLYTRSGRFDQDPASELPVLPLLARAKDLPALARDGDEFGFLETELLRGRNAVQETLRSATAALESYLAQSAR